MQQTLSMLLSARPPQHNLFTSGVICNLAAHNLQIVPKHISLWSGKKGPGKKLCFSFRRRAAVGALGIGGSSGRNPDGAAAVPDPQPDDDPEFPEILTGTRLTRLISGTYERLKTRWVQSRRDIPSKVLLLLLGFYSSNALSTVLGQTGDWDVLAAGILVAIFEILGYAVYKILPRTNPNAEGFFVRWYSRTLRSLLLMANYWKAGFIFGLFVDAFKVGS